jgi:hypothetical protein
MPTDTERRLEQLENLLLFGGGVAAGTASGRQLAAAAARRAPSVAVRGAGTAGRVGLAVARRHPFGTAATLAYLGYIHRDDIRDVAEAIGEGAQEVVPGVQTAVKAGRRKVSKANKAVKHAMGLLKAGTKRSTGADKGKLPKGAFKIATKAAGLANPLTPSNIGKGKGKVKSLARKLKKWWK